MPKSFFFKKNTISLDFTNFGISFGGCWKVLHHEIPLNHHQIPNKSPLKPIETHWHLHQIPIKSHFCSPLFHIFHLFLHYVSPFFRHFSQFSKWPLHGSPVVPPSQAMLERIRWPRRSWTKNLRPRVARWHSLDKLYNLITSELYRYIIITE